MPVAMEAMAAWGVTRRQLSPTARAGAKGFHIGFESINPSNLAAEGKRHNEVAAYQELIDRLRHAGIMLAAGIMFGLDDDTPDVFAEMAKIMPSLDNITWDRLEREDAVTYPVDAPDQPGNEIMFADGFPTASGRGKIVPTDLVPPDELPDGDYPMVLTTGRVLEHFHTGSMSRRSQVLETLEPESHLDISPQDSESMGVEEGDTVLVRSRRGEIVTKVHADRRIQSGTAFMAFHWKEAPANVLTNPAIDPVSKIPEFKVASVKTERISDGSVVNEKSSKPRRIT